MSGDTYSATETARLLGVSTKRVRQLVATGSLIAIKDSKPLAIQKESVHRERSRRSDRKPDSNLEGVVPLSQLAELLERERINAEKSARLQLESAERALELTKEQFFRVELEAREAREKVLELTLELERLKVEKELRSRKWFKR